MVKKMDLRCFLVPAYAILAFWYPLPAGKFLKMDHYGVLLEGFPAILLSIQFFAVVVLWCYFAFGGKARLTKSEEEETQITQW
jgi:hypothetical protein